MFTLFVGLVSYDGDESQSDSETTNDLKKRIRAVSENDNVRVTISGLVVTVSLWLAIPPSASGLRAKVRS
jgi:hypothetical protein